jgi:hypothetical protein
MAGPRSERLVAAVLRCYPARWRRRHGDEAAELATLLMRDGTPARSIAWNYLTGAARAQLASPPARRVGAAAGALLVTGAGLGLPLALSSSPPAGAASVTRAPTRAPARALAREPARGPAADRARPARKLDQMLRSGCLIGEPAARARAQLGAAHARVSWHGTGLVSATKVSSHGVISIFLLPVDARRPAGHGQGC